ncbi:hypothetical protein L0938_15810 [Paracidovorax citrulli]
MKLLTSLLFCCVTALFSPSAAADQIINCDGCTPQEMFDAGSRVITRQQWNKPHPSVYVTNVPASSAIRLAYANNVDQNFDWENDLFEAWAVHLPVDPTIIQFIANVNSIVGNLNVYIPSSSAAEASSSPNARELAYASNDDYPHSAYDVVSSSAQDLKVAYWLASGWTGARQAVINAMNQVLPVNGFYPLQLTWVITVNFTDGTFAKYSWDAATVNFKRISRTARDTNGNIIPETKADVAAGGYQEYVFSSGGGGAGPDEFLARLTQMGVPISWVGGVGARTRIACVDAGGYTVCEIMQY